MPFIIIFAILLLLLMHNIRRAKNKQAHNSAEFWRREDEANKVRKQDVSNLDYVYIPMETLPFGANTSEECIRLEETIRSLDSTKILNLNQYSNTDLKLQYGAANLAFLSECDDRFTTLARTLNRWAILLEENQQVSEAVQVAEYAVEIGVDTSSIYYMLTDYYRTYEDDEALEHLKELAAGLTGLNAPQIRDYLNKSQDA